MTRMEFVRMVLLELRDGSNNDRISEAMAATAVQERDAAKKAAVTGEAK